ncbi:MAG TPA: histidine phosphatase family protein [Candidatus Angelobacter sp.]|nr:histidine phosphatase family protein [Candidatus Angelobacter sp.]
MSRLFVVRHGQASFMEQDYDKLSPVGETQARLLGEYWARRRVLFDRVYSGPRVRQIETARIVGDAYTKFDLPWPEPVIMPEFDEYHGESVMDASLPQLVESNPMIRELHEAFKNSRSLNEQHKTFQRLFEVVIGKWVAQEIVVDNVESWQEFSARVHQGLSKIAAADGKGQQVALFSSGGPIGITVQRALELAPEMTLKIAWMARNCSFTDLLFSGDRFTLSSFNAFPHLDDPAVLTYR